MDYKSYLSYNQPWPLVPHIIYLPVIEGSWMVTPVLATELIHPPAKKNLVPRPQLLPKPYSLHINEDCTFFATLFGRWYGDTCTSTVIN
jgi:hypothetical protein